MSCCSTDKNVQLLRQQITANYQALHAEIENVSLSALPPGQIFIGDSNSEAVPRTVSGDVTINSTGVTAIAPGVITNADVSATAAIATTKLALDAINTKYSYLNGAGSYTIPFGAKVVETDAELRAALLIGGTIFVKGTITLTSAISLSVAGTTLMGFNYNQSKLVMSDSALSETRVITPNAINCTIQGLTIQGNATSAVRQTGILSEGFRTNSGLTIQDCHITRVYYGISQTGGETSPPNENIRILGNKISDFFGGISWSWTTNGLDVVGNTIIGDGSEYLPASKSKWNAIWIGLGINKLRVCNNTVGSVQRIGIEIFWAYKFNVDGAGGADYSEASKYKADAGVVISGNIISDCGSMGLSVPAARNGIIANNSISNVRWIGLELVGDALESTGGVVRPNPYVNNTVIGNSVYNVTAQPRGLKKAYKPTHSTTSTAIYPNFAATGSVDLNTVVAGTTVVTITLSSPYPTLQVGKQLIAKDTSLPTTNTFTAKIVTYNASTGVLTALVSAKTGTATVSAWTVFVRRTVILQLDSAVAMAWSANFATAAEGDGWTLDSLGQQTLKTGAFTQGIMLQDTVTAGNQIFGLLVNYNSSTQLATLELTSCIGVATTSISTWRAFNYNANIVGISIDQIDGVLFADNFISTIVDNSRRARPAGTLENVSFGVQIFKARNVYVFNNVWTRCGQLAILVNTSLNVVVESNKFLSPIVEGTDSTGVSVTRVLTGANAGSIEYDPTNPVTELGEDKGENGGVSVFVTSSPKTIVRNNYIRNSSANDLVFLTNGNEIYSGKFMRPEGGRFGNDVYLKGNDFRDITNFDTAYPSAPVDYTVRWTNNTEEFTGYRFHVDPNLSLAESKAFAVSVGGSKYIYNWFLSSTSTVAAPLPNITLPLAASVSIKVTGFAAISSPLRETYLADPSCIVAGTFVRAVPVIAGVPDHTQYFEGIVSAYNATTTTVTITTYHTTLSGDYNNWRLYCDQDAVYVSKTGDLVLRNDIRSDKTVGTKIGQTAAEKFAFWGATPVVQPATVANATNATDVITQVNAVIARLKTLGLIAT